MHILVTGHLGYIGPVAVRILKQAGHRVTGLDVGYFRDCVADGNGLVAPDREIVRDMRDVGPRDLEGVDAVVHLAALSNDPMGELDPALTHSINTQATLRMAALAREAGVGRLVFASSCSIYGAAEGQTAPLTEEAPFNPVSAYAVSKVATEQGLRELAADGFSPVFLRNATAFGVSGRLRFDLVLNNLAAWAHTSGSIKVLSDGTPWRPLVHIEDIAAAILAAAEAPAGAVHAQAFNIGRADANHQVRDIAEAVGRCFAGARVDITGETAGDPRSYRVDFSKALTRLPGFTPGWTLERGCAELRDWLKSGRLDGRDFQSRTFIRLKQLRHLMETGKIDGALRLRQTAVAGT